MGVLGDGNCCYRALSLALFGSQEHHLHIRLLCALEMHFNWKYYDFNHPDYCDLLKDDRLHRTNYRQLLRSTINIGVYAGLEHILAASAALGCGIVSYYPPTTVNQTSAYCRPIYGPGVRPCKGTSCTLMWTQMGCLSDPQQFRPNHFAVLAPVKKATVEVVDLTQDERAPSYAEAVRQNMVCEIQ